MSDSAEQNGSGYLTTDAILSAPDLAEVDVECPEWGGKVRIRSITKAKQQELRDAATVNDEIDSDSFEMQLVVTALVEPQFSPDQASLLREKNAAPINRIIARILDSGGMTPEAVKQAEASFRQE